MLRRKRLAPVSRQEPQTVEDAIRTAGPLLWRGLSWDNHAQGHLIRIAEVIGHRPLRELRMTDLDDLVFALEDSGRGKATIDHHLSVLRKLLRWCEDRGYLEKMPRFPWQNTQENKRRSRRKAIDRATEEKLIAYMREHGQHDIADLIAVAADTGCRRGELLSDFRVEGGFLHLDAEHTKTAWPRSVPLTPRAAEILKRAGLKTCTAGRVRWWWEKAVKDLGLPKGTVFHALRHACGTRLIEAEVNLRVVQEYLGHKSIATTIGYTHPSRVTLAEAAKALAVGE